MKRAFHILIITVFITLYSCGEESSKESQGIITYKVTYPKMDKDNFMLDMMPTKMVLKFKNNKYITTLSAGMGLFKTNFIIDKNTNQFSQMVKLIDKKYILTLQGDDISTSISNLPTYHIEQTDETKKILGYNCKKTIISIGNNTNETFIVYHTNKIEIETPNWSNQFKEIDGVMLEYQYEKYGVLMQFKAQNIAFTEIDDNVFEIDNKYKPVTEVEMNEEMQAIFDSFL